MLKLASVGTASKVGHGKAPSGTVGSFGSLEAACSLPTTVWTSLNQSSHTALVAFAHRFGSRAEERYDLRSLRDFAHLRANLKA
jgi:hypothetical protein|tara:strand:+ start:1696 stop:1947 length:252 start_codon:yes stop_codon:yes gene_type:complete